MIVMLCDLDKTWTMNAKTHKKHEILEIYKTTKKTRPG